VLVSHLWTNFSEKDNVANMRNGLRKILAGKGNARDVSLELTGWPEDIPRNISKLKKDQLLKILSIVDDIHYVKKSSISDSAFDAEVSPQNNDGISAPVSEASTNGNWSISAGDRIAAETDHAEEAILRNMIGSSPSASASSLSWDVDSEGEDEFSIPNVRYEPDHNMILAKRHRVNALGRNDVAHHGNNKKVCLPANFFIRDHTSTDPMRDNSLLAFVRKEVGAMKNGEEDAYQALNEGLHDNFGYQDENQGLFLKGDILNLAKKQQETLINSIIKELQSAGDSLCNQWASNLQDLLKATFNT
jgi:hypothetical protein